MNGAFWWIDRWRKSTAFTDMTAEEQGLYRNLLDELWLRDNHVIPNDQRILARVSGDHDAWSRCGAKVLEWMDLAEGGWTNATAMEVIGQAKRRARKQKAYRSRHPGNTHGNGHGNAHGNQAGSPSPSPSPSLISSSPSPSPSPEKKGRDPLAALGGSSTPTESTPAPESAEALVSLFQEVLPDLPAVRQPIGPENRKQLKAALRWRTLEGWRSLFQSDVATSDFLTGRKTDFVATLWWLIGPKNRVKVERGDYRNRSGGNGATPNAIRMRDAALARMRETADAERRAGDGDS